MWLLAGGTKICQHFTQWEASSRSFLVRERAAPPAQPSWFCSDFHCFHSNLPTWSSLILKDSLANSLKLGSPQTLSGRWCTTLPLPKQKAVQPHCQSSRDPNMTSNPILKPFCWTARLKLAEFRIMFLIKQKIASILFLSYTLLKWPSIPNENCIGKFPETEVWH